MPWLGSRKYEISEGGRPELWVSRGGGREEGEHTVPRERELVFFGRKLGASIHCLENP
jgi:hypothetical protein